MKRVITAAVLIVLVFLLVFKGTFFLVVLSTALVAELAVWEYLSLAEAAGAETPRVLVLLAIALLFAAIFRNADLAMPAMAASTLILFAVCAFRSKLAGVLPDAAISVFALIYIGLSLSTIPLLWAQENGPSLLLFLFCVVWAGDVAALYVGRAFGRRKLAPRISPNKTWAGSYASLAGSLFVAALLFSLARALGGGRSGGAAFPIAYEGPLVPWLTLAFLLNVAAQVGDLLESAIKRGCGAKDSGAILPGHGGMLDRIDALLLAAPVLWYARLAQQYF
jgi:phosphatidate cytidylyltransferase